MNLKLILDYLRALKMNNNQEWYHSHKEEKKEADDVFHELLKDLIIELMQFDNTITMFHPKDLTFKLSRDTRFSHDKSPYNPTFRAHIAPAGKLPVPVGYFISIAPNDQSFLGGGLFAPMFKDATTMIRDFIASHGEEFKSIIEDSNFADNFTVKGEALKKIPAGYESDTTMSEYLKNKSWYVEYNFKDDILCDANEFINISIDRFKKMKPLNDYLNRALRGFVMPVKK